MEIFTSFHPWNFSIIPRDTWLLKRFSTLKKKISNIVLQNSVRGDDLKNKRIKINANHAIVNKTGLFHRKPITMVIDYKMIEMTQGIFGLTLRIKG